MLGALQHIKSDTIADLTGTITIFNSAGSTTTVAATDLVRPSDWNSTHNFDATISGNTLGSNNVQNATNVVLAGGSNITLSMVTAASAATVSIIADGGRLSRMTDWGVQGTLGTSSSITGASASFRVFSVLEALSMTQAAFPIRFLTLTAATTATEAVAMSSAFVIYTQNASTLSPIIGMTSQTTISYASNTANYSSVSGYRYATFPMSTILEPGEYFAGFQISSNTSSVGASTTNLADSIFVSFIQPFWSSTFLADFGTTQSTTNMGFMGIHTNTITATNQTIAMSNISVSGSNQARANIPLIFRAN